MKTDYAITFFYYEDILPIARFYEETLGFELVLDQGLARIYRVAPNSYFGIVDGNRGHLRHQPQSAALFTVVAEDVEGEALATLVLNNMRRVGKHAMNILEALRLEA